MTGDTVSAWQRELDGFIAGSRCFSAAFACDCVTSTQDEVRRRNASPGTIVAALRQTAGRGREGKTWADTRTDGLAVSFVVPAVNLDRQWVLGLVCAIATAEGIESLIGQPTGIKWPNDIILNRRKVAGILIEQQAGRAIVGIGINVHQSDWPTDLADKAISLKQAGARVERIDALTSVARSLDNWLSADQKVVLEAFERRDVLTGSRAAFVDRDTRAEGIVERIDPRSSIWLRQTSGVIEVSAARAICVSARGEAIDL